MKNIALLLGMLVVFSSCSQNNVSSSEENADSSMNDAVSEEVTVTTPQVEERVVDKQTRKFIDKVLIGTWILPENEFKNLQINDDDTFQFNFIGSDEVPLTGTFIVKDMRELFLTYGLEYKQYNIVENDKGDYTLVNTEEGETYIQE